MSSNKSTTAKKRSSTSSAQIGTKSAFNSTKSATAAAAASKKKAVSATASKKVESDEDESFDADRWPTLFKHAQKKMGKAVHDEGLTQCDIILKVFDCTDAYGPASNISRLERYERATRLGLNPPAELGVLLRSAPARYKNSAFNV